MFVYCDLQNGWDPVPVFLVEKDDNARKTIAQLIRLNCFLNSEYDKATKHLYIECPVDCQDAHQHENLGEGRQGVQILDDSAEIILVICIFYNFFAIFRQ